MQHGLGVIPGVNDQLELLLAMLGLAGATGYALLIPRRAKRFEARRTKYQFNFGLPHWLNSRYIIAALIILVGVYYLLRAIAYYTSVEEWAANLIKFGGIGLGITILLFVLNRKLKARGDRRRPLRILGGMEDILLVVSFLAMLAGGAFEYIQIDPGTYDCVLIGSDSLVSVDVDAASYNDIGCNYIIFSLNTMSLERANDVLYGGYSAPYFDSGTYRVSICPEDISAPTQTSALDSSVARPPTNYGDYVPISLRKQLLSVADSYLDKATRASQASVKTVASGNQATLTQLTAYLSALDKQHSACKMLNIVVKDANSK